MAIICNVPNREYINALRQCAKEHENDNVYTGQIDTTALCNDTAKLLENDVIERSKVDKAIEEIDFLRQHRAKYITEDSKVYIDSKEVLKILKNIGE